jgi:hypothetical protein
MAFMRMSVLDNDTFLNVDLEIFSKSDLQLLVATLGRRIHLHFIGMEFGLHKAHFDLAQQPETPEAGILAFCRLIQKLPQPERALWDSAKFRSFDIGIEAPGRGRYFWSAIGSKAIEAAANAGAQIAITIYRPMKAAGPAKRKARSSPRD